MLATTRLRLGLGLVSLMLLAGCTTKPVTAPVVDTPPPPGPVEPVEPPAVHARILAVGDLLMHTYLVSSSQTGEDEFDFKPLFEPVRPWIAGADLAIANLETTLTGDPYPWAGYPSFNTPPVLARDLKEIGFDVLTHANNHSLDYDEYGLVRTSEALERYGIPHTGTNRTAAEQEQILVVDVAPTIKMAVLAYTYGTNGIPLPHPWSVNMLEPERIRADIRKARQMPEVDLVAVALHFGDEYVREPNEEQKSYVELSLQAGADIVLGDHPHVIQPIHVQRVKDEFGRDLPRAVIYSEGNFISNQEGRFKEAGLMLIIDVKKEKGLTTVESVSFVPTWVHPYKLDGKDEYRVVAVEQAMRDYEAQKDPLITPAHYQRLKEVWADTTGHAPGSPEVKVLGVDQPKAVQK